MKEDSKGIPEEVKVKFLDEGTFSVVKASIQHLMVINYHYVNQHYFINCIWGQSSSVSVETGL
jgi:hypothetical protein